MMRVGVITISDRGYRGEREDTSGEVIQQMVQGLDAEVAFSTVIPDEKDEIKKVLLHGVDELELDLILTTGGTGVSPRDVTPDATLEVIEKEILGFSEAMRMEGLKKTPHAIISRAVCGVRGRTLIINLPGSPKGVREGLEVILPALPHAVAKIQGDPSECGR
ncbi:MAG: MogA/MoaB family molybdenum cofactor biosynthesis protein [Deltaproteobacteria bacterium]|nr:MAG: MogA/MoaB family molybdenum cofactor biosynthesis protein [Deltaproteobacteria bacterium]